MLTQFDRQIFCIHTIEVKPLIIWKYIFAVVHLNLVANWPQTKPFTFHVIYSEFSPS